MNWGYPFVPSSGNTADPQTWLKALARADSGFYPLGANGMFHGGVHFDAATGGALKQGDGIRVIGDGEVIAYRLDSAYRELTYPAAPNRRYALYSTGFVLVRHRLVLPPAPKPSGTSVTGASATGANGRQPGQPPADDVLEFYSPYMHQLDWAGYQAAARTPGDRTQSAPSIHPLPFWQGNRHFRVGDKAKDRQELPPQLNTPFRFDLASVGSEVPTLGNGAQLGGMNAAAGTTPDSIGSIERYTDSKVRLALPAIDADAQASRNSVAADTLQRAEGIRIRDRASGAVIGLLPRGGEISVVGNATTGRAQVAKIIKGMPVAVVAGATPDPRAVTGWVYLDELDAIVDPRPLDTVVVLDTPFKVKAGDVVGYLGEYQRYRESQLLPPKPMRPTLHVEVFTGAPIRDFISRSQERAKSLPASGKTLLVIRPGAKLVNPAEPDRSSQVTTGLMLVLTKDDPGKGYWAKVQPTRPPQQSSAHDHAHRASGTPIGTPLWVERSEAGKAAGLAVRTWSAFPLQLANAQAPAVGFQRVLARGQLDQFMDISNATDDHGTHWWQFSAGDADGTTFWGWVCEKDHPDTQWASPWSWPGFGTVDTTDIPLLDLYRRNLYETKQLLDGEEEEFSILAATVNAGLLIGKLEKAVDRQGNGKGTVTPAELRKAMTVPWMAEAISHLIVRYESEWGDMGKWDKLSSVMGNGKHIWQAELERIEKLQWWDEVKAIKGFPADPAVWHIHPIGVVGNFIERSSLDELIRRIGDIIAGGEGGYESYNTGTKGVPGGKVGHSYIRPPTGTVTNKTINEILATDALSGTDPSRFFATGKYQTILQTLRAAKGALGLTGEERYDADMQERIFRDYLIDDAGGGALAAYLKKGQGTVDDAQLAAAKCWASIAAPEGAQIKDGRISDGRLSYHESRANAANLESTAQLRKSLEQLSRN